MRNAILSTLLLMPFLSSGQWQYITSDFGGDTTFQPKFYLINADTGYCIAGRKAGDQGVFRHNALYTTNNAGKNWIRISSQEPITAYGICGYGKDTILVGLGTKLVLTTDAGNSWDTVLHKSGTPLSFKNGQILLLSDSSIWSSYDYGKTWNRVTNFDSVAGSPQFISMNQGYIVDIKTDQFLESLDTGITWEVKYNFPFDLGSMNYSLRVVSEDLIFLMADQKLMKSTDGGATWTILKNLGGNVSNFDAGFYFVNAKDGFYAFAGYLYKTNDSGQTWCQQQQVVSGASYISDINSTMSFLNDSVGIWANGGGVTGVNLYTTFNQGGPACPSGPGVGINPVNSNWSVSIYPNPAVDMVVIESERESLAKICLYNLTGQKVVEVNAPGHRSEIPVSGLSAGIYLIEIKSSTGSVYRNKVLVQ